MALDLYLHLCEYVSTHDSLHQVELNLIGLGELSGINCKLEHVDKEKISNQGHLIMATVSS